MKYHVLYKRNNEWLARAANVTYEQALLVVRELYIEGKTHVEIVRV